MVFFLRNNQLGVCICRLLQIALFYCQNFHSFKSDLLSFPLKEAKVVMCTLLVFLKVLDPPSCFVCTGSISYTFFTFLRSPFPPLHQRLKSSFPISKFKCKNKIIYRANKQIEILTLNFLQRKWYGILITICNRS